MALETYDGDSELGLWRFERVAGRCNLSVSLDDGTRIHLEAFAHCVRDYSEKARYQMIQKENEIKLLIVKNNKRSQRRQEEIRSKLAKIRSSMYKIKFEITDKLKETAVGKTPMIIRQDTARI